MTHALRTAASGVILGLITLGFSAAAQAQVSPDFTATDSFQARATITIPFGGDRKKAQSKPQFALGLRSETARPNVSDWALRPSFDAVDVREFKLGLTFEDRPTILLNDQVLPLGDALSVNAGQAGALDKYDKTVLTVIGVSLAVIAGSIIILAD